MNLRVMTFNLRMNTPDDGRNAWYYRKEHVAKTMKDAEPDIVGTQEGLHHMITNLQAHLPAYGVIGEGRGGGNYDEYNAIFYKKERFTLVEHGQFWLSETPEVVGSSSWNSAYPRICTWGKFSHVEDSNQTFFIFNTHLDHEGQFARDNGIHLINSFIKPVLKKMVPYVLMGDFNCEFDNEVITQLEESNLERAQTAGRTFHNFMGGSYGEPIDYIFFSDQLQMIDAGVDQRAFNGKFPSDHYPVIGNLEFN